MFGEGTLCLMGGGGVIGRIDCWMGGVLICDGSIFRRWDRVNWVAIPVRCMRAIDDMCIKVLLFCKFFYEGLLRQLYCQVGVVVGVVNLDTKEVVKFVVECDFADMSRKLACKFFFNGR